MYKRQGIGNFANYSGSDWVQYSIPVGSFYTGSFDRLFFVNDNDAGSGNNSFFRNVTVHEGTCGSLATAQEASEEQPLVAQMGTESEFSLSLSPNPATDRIRLVHSLREGVFTVSSLSGQALFSGRFLGEFEEEVDIRELPAGIYLLNIESGEISTSLKFRKR